MGAERSVESARVLSAGRLFAWQNARRHVPRRRTLRWRSDDRAYLSPRTSTTVLSVLGELPSDQLRTRPRSTIRLSQRCALECAKMLPLLITTWPYALVFWAVFVWAFAPEFRVVSTPADPVKAPYDAHSKRLIVLGQGAAMFAAFLIPSTIAAARVPHALWCFWIGVTAVVVGGLLRRHCKRSLGSSFTGAVIVKRDQVVIERGAYRYIRHPSYTAGTIMFTGIGLALDNWISLLVLLIVVPTVYAYRVRVEERALVTVVGEPYRRYMSRTKRFVPFLF